LLYDDDPQLFDPATELAPENVVRGRTHIFRGDDLGGVRAQYRDHPKLLTGWSTISSFVRTAPARWALALLECLYPRQSEAIYDPARVARGAIFRATKSNLRVPVRGERLDRTQAVVGSNQAETREPPCTGDSVCCGPNPWPKACA
jgi:hypothetical protein